MCVKKYEIRIEIQKSHKNTFTLNISNDSFLWKQLIEKKIKFFMNFIHPCSVRKLILP